MTAARTDALLRRLPHGARARWVRRVVETGPDRVVAEGAVPDGSPLIRNGRVPGFAALELCAQASALLEVATPIATGNGHGMIVRFRDVAIDRPWFDAGARLIATVDRSGAAPPLYTYEARVRIAEGSVLEGTLAILVPG